MTQESPALWKDEVDAFIHRYGNRLNAFIVCLAFRMKVHSESEDLKQDFWLRVSARWERIRMADNPLSYVHPIARNTVTDFVSGDKVLVHVWFTEDCDVRSVLGELYLENSLELLKKCDSSGRPTYSGKVWPSQIPDISSHPCVSFINFRENRIRVSAEINMTVEPPQVEERSELLTKIERAFESIRDKLPPTKASAFDLCDFQLLPENVVGAQLSLKPKTIRRYRADVRRVLRQECPWLRVYLGRARFD